MADLVVTAASVVAGTPSVTDDGTAGEALTAGQCVYLKTSDGRWYKADANVTTVEAGADGLKIALNNAPGAGQPVKLLRNGNVNLGATLAIGQVYVVSATAGGIAPFADLVITNLVSILGVATTAALLNVPSGGPLVSGAAHF